MIIMIDDARSSTSRCFLQLQSAGQPLIERLKDMPSSICETYENIWQASGSYSQNEICFLTSTTLYSLGRCCYDLVPFMDGGCFLLKGSSVCFNRLTLTRNLVCRVITSKIFTKPVSNRT